MNKSGSTLRSIKKRANALIKAGKPEQARELYHSICKNYQSDTDSWLILAGISHQLHAYKDAEYCARHVLSILPSSEPAYIALGSALQCLRKPDEARTAYEAALRIHPGSIEANHLLAGVYLERGITSTAAAYYKKVLDLSPNHIEALNNLSAIYTNLGSVQESINLLEHALELQPDGYHMLINLARSHLFSGNAAKTHDILRRVINLYPDSPEAHSKYLMSLNYLGNIDPQNIAQEHSRWSDRHTGNISRYKSYDNKLTTKKLIRVGYVSPDFKTHPVSYFIEPILTTHDKSKFHVTCYADIATPDETSARLESACDNWRITYQASNAQLAEIIRTDEIDILVDLAGHTANNRLLVFARKPAPIQVSYLGYPNTTGLKEIDYRLTDLVADPESSQAYNAESLIRLPNGFLCYSPPESSPDVSKREPLSPGDITFGSFNNLAKVTTDVINTWSRLLKALPNSKLLLKSKATADPYTRSRITRLFENEGIDSNRLLLTGYIIDNSGHLGVYNNVDVALDTFPYNGTTTTCEALWMGTPVVTLKGNTHGSRVSASILSGLSMTEYIALDANEYIEIAINLANDTSRLTNLHVSLRDTMRKSPICNTRLVTRDIEATYTEIWNRYCNSNVH